MRGCSGGEGCAWLLLGGMCGCSGGHARLLWGDMHGCSGGHVWLLGGHAWLLRGACVVALGGGIHGIQRDTEMIDEWVVRILLECIFVLTSVHIFQIYNFKFSFSVIDFVLTLFVLSNFGTCYNSNVLMFGVDMSPEKVKFT